MSELPKIIQTEPIAKQNLTSRDTVITIASTHDYIYPSRNM